MGIKQPGGRKMEKIETQAITNAAGAARVSAPRKGSNVRMSSQGENMKVVGDFQSKKLSSNIKVSGGP